MIQSASGAPARILVVEDEPDMVLGLEHNLRFEGFEVETAQTGTGGLEAFRRNPPDLVLLDVMLPGMDGFSILSEIRSTGSEVPVILLTAKSLEADKIHGFNLGADDYVTKPFSIRELMARIQAVLRRAQPEEEEEGGIRTFGDVEVDLVRRECRKAGKEVQLSFKEFEVLHLLLDHEGETVTREMLLEKVWGRQADDLPTTRTVDTHIANLRRKVEGGQDRNHYIRTVHKVGYKFVSEGKGD